MTLFVGLFHFAEDVIQVFQVRSLLPVAERKRVEQIFIDRFGKQFVPNFVE